MKEQEKNRKKIGLLGPVTSGNLGNAALEAAAVQRLAKQFPDDEFYVCTRDSLEGLKDFGVRQFPFRRNTLPGTQPTVTTPSADRQPKLPEETFGVRAALKRIPGLRSGVRMIGRMINRGKSFKDEIRFLIQSYRFAKRFRYLIVCGGGQLDDVWDGPWGLPYALFTWALMAKLAGCPFVVASVGAERVRTRLGRFFLRRTLKIAQYRSYRDASSRRIVEGFGVSGEQFVCPDLAFSLEIPANAASGGAAPKKRIAGVSPMAYCDPRSWPEKNAEKYRRHLEVLAELCEKLVQDGWELVVFASQNRMDKPVLEDFQRMLTGKGLSGDSANISFAETRNLKELLQVVSGVQQVVAARLHGALLSLRCGTPVVALAYEAKVEALMNHTGLAEYCLPIETTTVDELYEHFGRLSTADVAIREMVQGKVQEFQAALERQYEAIIELNRA